MPLRPTPKNNSAELALVLEGHMHLLVDQWTELIEPYKEHLVNSDVNAGSIGGNL